MGKLIKIAKIILSVQTLTLVIVFGNTLLTIFLPESAHFFERFPSISVTVLLGTLFAFTAISAVALLFVLILPFLILVKRNRLEPSEENQISALHLLLLFSPVFSIVPAILLYFIPSPSQIRCPTAVYGIQVSSIYGTLQFVAFLLFLAPIVISLLVSTILLIKRERKGRNAALLSLLATIIYLIAGPLLFSITSASLNSARSKSVDARRIADVKQVQLALELYLDQFRSYPGVSATSPDERWEELRSALTPRFIPTLPEDPCSHVSKEFQYDYKNSPGGTSYVIRALLNEQSNPALTGYDKDGEVLGIWCGEQGKEREYCAGSE